jgi:hypothetical protein
MVKNNKILYFIIFKHKNLSLINSFGEYKSYWSNGQLWRICNYINGKKYGINKLYSSQGILELDEIINHYIGDDTKVIIEEIDLEDILINGKEKYNSNNHNKDITDEEYQNKLNKTYLPYWIDIFKDNYIVLNIDIPKWFYDAHSIGIQTGKFSKIYEDELEEYILKYKHFDEILRKGYFIRTNKVSLKFGYHGCGPYYNMKQIIESILSGRKGHTCLDEDLKSLKIYLIDWVDINKDLEFRVFVYKNNITCISQQNIYTSNNILNNIDKENRNIIISKWIETIYKYFNDKIKPNILHIDSYSIDLAIINDNIYFIELNSFGKEMAAGSAAFHWLIDEKKYTIHLKYILDMLYKNKFNLI